MLHVSIALCMYAIGAFSGQSVLPAEPLLWGRGKVGSRRICTDFPVFFRLVLIALLVFRNALICSDLLRFALTSSDLFQNRPEEIREIPFCRPPSASPWFVHACSAEAHRWMSLDSFAGKPRGIFGRTCAGSFWTHETETKPWTMSGPLFRTQGLGLQVAATHSTPAFAQTG